MSLAKFCHNKFKKFNNTVAQVLNFIYHNCDVYILKFHFGMKLIGLKFVILYAIPLWTLLHKVTTVVPTKSDSDLIFFYNCKGKH